LVFDLIILSVFTITSGINNCHSLTNVLRTRLLAAPRHMIDPPQPTVWNQHGLLSSTHWADS